VSAAPLIPYAGTPARWGVTVLREPHLFRLTVPPLPSLRYLHPGYWIAFSILLVLMVFQVPLAPRHHWHEVFIPIVTYTIPLSWVFTRAWVRLHRTLTFTITADTFTLTTHLGRRIGRTDSWPRSQIGSAHRNASSGQLIIRITGRDLRDVYVNPNRQVVDFVCAELTQALSATYTDPAPLAPNAPIPEAQRATRPIIRVSWILSVVVTALFVLTYFVPWIFWAGIVAAIPMGIYFGTQEKEYWP